MVEIRGNAVAHTAEGHLGLPHVLNKGIRPTHRPTKAKTGGLNWDALTPSCAGCAQKSRELNDASLCPTCRGIATPAKTAPSRTTTDRDRAYITLDQPDLAKRFTAPDTTRLGRQLADLEQADPDVATAAASLDEAVDRITQPAQHDQAPKATVLEDLDSLIAIVVETGERHHREIITIELALRRLRGQLTTTDPEPSETPTQMASRFKTFERPRRAANKRTSSGERAPRRDRIVLDGPAVAQAYADGQTLAELATAHGVSAPTISRTLDEQGVVRRKQKVAYSPELIEQIRALYVAEQLDQAQVAERLGLTTKVIQTAMTRGQITPRESASARSARGIGHPIKITDDIADQMVARYTAGEAGPPIARDFGVAAASLYHLLTKRGIARHGRRTPGLGRDGSTGLKARIADLGFNAQDINAWADETGLRPRRPGMPPRAVVEAYAAAHAPTEGHDAA